MLSLIYKDIKDVTLLDSWEQRDDILKAIMAAPKEDLLPAASEEENW